MAFHWVGATCAFSSCLYICMREEVGVYKGLIVNDLVLWQSLYILSRSIILLITLKYFPISSSDGKPEAFHSSEELLTKWDFQLRQHVSFSFSINDNAGESGVVVVWTHMRWWSKFVEGILYVSCRGIREVTCLTSNLSQIFGADSRA